MNVKLLGFALLAICPIAGAQTPSATEARSLSALGDVLERAPLAKADIEAKAGVVPFAPAPPLTRLFVYAVGSTNCNWEYMTTIGQVATTCNHGGAQLRAAVLEIGYGSNPVAWMIGGVLPSSAHYQTTPVCITGSNYTWPCTAGQTVVGFLRYFNLDGHQNGIFREQNTSTNSPWNTMSTQINIQ
jgi:hypothetical protein